MSKFRATPARSAAAVVLGLLLAACGSQPEPTPGVLPSTIATPAPPLGSSQARGLDGSGSPGPGISSPVASTTGGKAAVTVDPALLSFIPISGHGLIQMTDPDTTLQVAQDPDLIANATGLMIASYIPDRTFSSGAPGEDIAVVSVVRLRDPAADDVWFRGWRDSYDKAACANASGVARNSQVEIGTHTVFIGACQGGSFTYHTRLSSGAIVVSITSVGGLHLGETIMERLGP